MRNTSSLSYGHFRLAEGKNFFAAIKASVEMLGEDKEKMEFVYSRTHLVPEFLKELKIKFRKRSFGVIPETKIRGGAAILKKLQKDLPIITSTQLIDFEKINDKSREGFDLTLKRPEGIYKLKTKYLVLATGGYGGKFRHTNNIRYSSYNIFGLVEKNRGKIINKHCIFFHPFGFKEGKEVLTGKESTKGEFIDSNGDFVFDINTRQKVRDDSYHEIFPALLRQIRSGRKKGLSVYFVSDENKKEKKEEIVPTVHYTSGGIKTDSIGKVEGCKNLFAIGECQANGSRNNGRLPGYPFTSAVVHAKALGEYFSKFRWQEQEMIQSVRKTALPGMEMFLKEGFPVSLKWT
jgi:aspartate oxidase